MRKEVSDLYFNKEVVSEYFSNFPPPSSLDQETFNAFADMYFCLSTYDYVWLYRDFKQQFASQGIDHVFTVENAPLLAKKCVEMCGSRELQLRKIELTAYFKEFLGMSESQLADYCIKILGGIDVC